jgi:hypothetical protein
MHERHRIGNDCIDMYKRISARRINGHFIHDYENILHKEYSGQQIYIFGGKIENTTLENF